MCIRDRNGTASKPQSKYKCPNEWVIDAVNVGASNEWQWNVTSTGLDMGHTYIGMNNNLNSLNKSIEKLKNVNESLSHTISVQLSKLVNSVQEATVAEVKYSLKEVYILMNLIIRIVDIKST